MNMVLQTYSPLFPGYLSRNKTAEEIDEDDPDLEIDCDLLYDDDEVYSEDNMYKCASFIHCAYSFCYLIEIHCIRFLSHLFGYQ